MGFGAPISLGDGFVLTLDMLETLVLYCGGKWLKNAMHDRMCDGTVSLPCGAQDGRGVGLCVEKADPGREWNLLVEICLFVTDESAPVWYSWLKRKERRFVFSLVGGRRSRSAQAALALCDIEPDRREEVPRHEGSSSSGREKVKDKQKHTHRHDS